jgi:hypothetical protein
LRLCAIANRHLEGTQRAYRKAGLEHAKRELLPRHACLFNGTIFGAEARDVIGVPDYRLFTRGEVYVGLIWKTLSQVADIPVIGTPLRFISSAPAGCLGPDDPIEPRHVARDPLGSRAPPA